MKKSLLTIKLNVYETSAFLRIFCFQVLNTSILLVNRRYGVYLRGFNKLSLCFQLWFRIFNKNWNTCIITCVFSVYHINYYICLICSEIETSECQLMKLDSWISGLKWVTLLLFYCVWSYIGVCKLDWWYSSMTHAENNSLKVRLVNVVCAFHEKQQHANCGKLSFIIGCFCLYRYYYHFSKDYFLK